MIDYLFLPLFLVVFIQTGQVLGRVNVVSGHVKTQLIAHDKEVYDIAFSRAGGGRDMFASVGKSQQVMCHTRSSSCITMYHSLPNSNENFVL